ncbi:MAG TPA: right-handed parallel beta-helix repeat-containing protein, partial [Chloroflexota bacterium]
RTIQHAADSATPGTTVHVSPGTYHDRVRSAVSGTAGNPIRFVSDVSWGARLRTAGAQFAWDNTADWVIIEGFDIGGDGSVGIESVGSHVQIVGNHVHDISGPRCDQNGGAGIDHGGYASGANDIVGNLVHDIGDTGSRCATIQGIYDSTQGGRIQNNIVYRTPAWGIHTWHAARRLIIANNLVFNNGLGGILVGAGDAPGGVTADGFLVTNNIVLDNPRGIVESGNTGCNQYVANLLFRNGIDASLKNGNLAAQSVSDDPRFVDYRSDGGGDYHLQATSPAIAAGTDQGAPGSDFEGAPRVGQYSIGPYR